MRSTMLLIAPLLAAISARAADVPPAVLKDWTTTAGAGLALTSGNTDTKNYNLSFATKYDPKTKFVFKADALSTSAASPTARCRSTKHRPMDEASTPYPTACSRSAKSRIFAIPSKT